MPEQDDDRSVLLHIPDHRGLCGFTGADRPSNCASLAEADVEGAAHVADSISAALGRSLAMEAPLQLRQALADLLFDEDDAVDERQRDVGV